MDPSHAQPPAGIYSRRIFLKLAGATGLVAASGGLIAACASTGGGQPSAGGGEPSQGAVGGDFALFTWAGYDGAEVLADWYADHNINLDVKYISNEDMIAFMKAPGAEKWDASSVNQGDNNHNFSQGIMAEITVDEVPALGQMYPFFRDSPIWKVRDGVYNSVPWTWGPIGINIRSDKVPEGISSYEELFDPKWSQRIGTYDSALNMISTAACATGLDPGRLTRDELNGPVREWLTRLKPQLKVLSTSIGDQVNLLVAGDVDIELVGLLWNVAQAKDQGVDVGFAVPEEGTFAFCDAVFITPWAPHRANALAYANALMEAPTAIQMLESLNQLGPIADVNAQVGADVRDLYPEDLEDFIDNSLKWNISYYDADGDFATIEEWQKVWDEVKALG